MVWVMRLMIACGVEQTASLGLSLAALFEVNIASCYLWMLVPMRGFAEKPRVLLEMCSISCIVPCSTLSNNIQQI